MGGPSLPHNALRFQENFHKSLLSYTTWLLVSLKNFEDQVLF